MKDKINGLETNMQKILETYTGAQINIKMFTNLKLRVYVGGGGGGGEI
jgi:hypothetical protein